VSNSIHPSLRWSLTFISLLRSSDPIAGFKETYTNFNGQGTVGDGKGANGRESEWRYRLRKGDLSSISEILIAPHS